MTATRREALAVTGSVLTAGLSGCQIPLFSEDTNIDIELRNYTPAPQQVRIEILLPDSDKHSEAKVFNENFEVPPPQEGESAGTVRNQNIVKRRPYIVRAQPKSGDGQWHHHHYFPRESTRDDQRPTIDVRLYRREDSDVVYPRFFM